MLSIIGDEQMDANVIAAEEVAMFNCNVIAKKSNLFDITFYHITAAEIITLFLCLVNVYAK